MEDDNSMDVDSSSTEIDEPCLNESMELEDGSEFSEPESEFDVDDSTEMEDDLAGWGDWGDLSKNKADQDPYDASLGWNIPIQPEEAGTVAMDAGGDGEMEILQGTWSQSVLYEEASLTDNVKCYQWCRRVGLIKTKTYCRVCRNKDKLMEFVVRGDHGGASYRCRKCANKTHGSSSGYTSALTDTVFEGSHLRPGKVLMLMHCFAYLSDYRQTQLACHLTKFDTEISKKTIAAFYKKIRQRVIVWYDMFKQETGKIGGENTIVQVDETLIGKMKSGKGRVPKGTWVVGMVSSDGDLRLEVCPRRNRETLEEVIKKHVKPGTEIHSDYWTAYDNLEKIGYKHKKVNHSKCFVAADGTNKITCDTVVTGTQTKSNKQIEKIIVLFKRSLIYQSKKPTEKATYQQTNKSTNKPAS